MSIDHGHFIDEEGFGLLAEKGAFLSSNLAALSPELGQMKTRKPTSAPSTLKIRVAF